MYVKVDFTHNVHPGCVREKRVSWLITLCELQNMCHGFFGTPVLSMRLQLHNERGEVLCDRLGDVPGTRFRDFSLHEGHSIHVIDQDNLKNAQARVSELTDVSLVEKYTMDEESYNLRPNSMRRYKESRMAEMHSLRRNIGSVDARDSESLEQNSDTSEVSSVVLGNRCCVSPGDRLGSVRYIGPLRHLDTDSKWVGVELDEPLGKNDGELKGYRYFVCGKNYGCFARLNQVSVGDYPPILF